MVSEKRLMVAMLMGLMMGISCYLVGTYVFGNDYSPMQIVNIQVNRVLIGFVIGISALRMPWAWHGALIGAVVGLPFLLFDYLAGFGMVTVVAVAIVNPLYGVIIELFTSRVFHLPAT